MRVVFVDDEPQILKGITRMLDGAGVDWDIDTAGSGEEALQLLKEQRADVIVSDMRMPGMDGAELLSEVSRLYPATVRIILSGQADKDAAYRAVSSLHQYLSKPCEASRLQEMIRRSCSLRNLLESTSSHEIVGRITSLPSIPDTHRKAIAEIDSENGSVSKVGKLMAQDPAMTAKILQLANSALFGIGLEVTCPSRAASLIGLDALKSLALSMSVFKAFEGSNFEGFSIDALAEHCMHVGSLARYIARCEQQSKEAISEAFTSGLLHDVGKLILAAHAQNEFSVAIAKSKSECIPLFEAEQAVLGIGHDGIGGYLLSLWGLPRNIVEGVAFHHAPQHCAGGELTIPGIVYIANHLSKSKHEPEQQVAFDKFISEMGLTERVEVWSGLSELEKAH